MEPLAALAVQPVWQAGKPIEFNINYDGGWSNSLPAFGLLDEIPDLQGASLVEYEVAHREKLLAKGVPFCKMQSLWVSFLRLHSSGVCHWAMRKCLGRGGDISGAFVGDDYTRGKLSYVWVTNGL
eukprot:644201-Karenia_brevis.AAC.2